MVVRRGFRQAASYHTDRLINVPVGHFFDVMTNGFGAMPSYASRVEPDDRWRIAAYIRVLQLSQNAPLDDVPADDERRAGGANDAVESVNSDRQWQRRSLMVGIAGVLLCATAFLLNETQFLRSYFSLTLLDRHGAGLPGNSAAASHRRRKVGHGDPAAVRGRRAHAALHVHPADPGFWRACLRFTYGRGRKRRTTPIIQEGGVSERAVHDGARVFYFLVWTFYA